MKSILVSASLVTTCVNAQFTAVWDGAIGSWDDGSHWSTNPDYPNNDTPPGATYDVVISGGEVTRDTSSAIGRLTMSGGKILFAASNPLAAASGFNWSGGSIEGAFEPGIISIAAATTSQWSGSPVLSKVVIENAGNLTLSDGIDFRVLAQDFEVSAGLRNLPGGTLVLPGSGSWLGQWFGEGPIPEGLNNQGNLIKNGTGTFLIGIDPEGFNGTPFQNSGTVTVQQGVLQIDAPVPASTGTWTAAAGSTIVFNGSTTLLPGASIQGAGDVVFSNGSGSNLAGNFSLTGSVTLGGTANFNSGSPISIGELVIDSSGGLTGTSPVEITGSLSWQGTINDSAGTAVTTLAATAIGSGIGDGTFRLEGRTFQNAGSFTWPGGSSVEAAKFDIYRGGNFINQAGASFAVAGNGRGSVTASGNTTGTFTNAGIFDKSGASTTTRLDWEFSNSGSIRALEGRLEVLKLTSSGGSFEVRNGAEMLLTKKQTVGFPATDHAGIYAVKSGGILEFGIGRLTSVAQFPDGTGTVSLVGAEVVRDSISADLLRFHGSVSSKVDPPSNLLTATNVALTAGGTIGLPAAKSMRVTGSLDWQNGGTSQPTGTIGGTGGVLELAAGSVTTLSGLGNISTSTVANAGSFTALSGGTLRVNALGILQNTGSMDFSNGTLLELRPSTSAASDAMLSGSTITTSGTGLVRIFTGRNSTSTPSYATLSGVTLNATTELVSNLSRLRLINGADIKGSVLYTAAASSGASNFLSVDIQQNATLTGVRFEDSSAAQAAKSILAVIGARTLTLGPTAECVNLRSILGDYFSSSTGQIIATGNSTIINEGSIRVEGSTRITQLGAIDSFENRGILKAENGASIIVDREFSQTSGRIQLVGGNFTMSTPTYRASTRVITVTGGSVEGQGTINGHLVMNGGTIAPGNSTGMLTLTGNLTLGGGSALDVGFASITNADQLVVQGTVSLGGAVQLVLHPGFQGAETEFTILANDGSDAIGTSPSNLFAVGAELLEEGEVFSAAGRTWQISYVGGDGNDVVLTLQAGGLSVLETWRQEFFGTTEGTGNAANDFDFDHDGVANLIEFAFGLDPTSAASADIPQAVRTVDGLVISFTPPSGVSGVSYAGETSADLSLGSWTPVPNTGVAPAHEYRLPFVPSGRGFLRLRVSENP